MIWGALTVPGNSLKQRFHHVIRAITEMVFQLKWNCNTRAWPRSPKCDRGGALRSVRFRWRRRWLASDAGALLAPASEPLSSGASPLHPVQHPTGWTLRRPAQGS